MKVYQDLKLLLDGSTKEQIIKKIDALLSSTWSRDVEREDELTKVFHGEKQHAYSTVNNSNLPNARLWLASNNKGELYVSNIIPCEGELTYEEYNLILKAFVEILRNDSSIRYELTEAERTLEDFVPQDVAQKLKSFSNNANKSTGYGHPCDFDRWLNFVISFHQHRCERRYDLIERWLHEEAGWSWEKASKLSSQLEYTLNLLKYYDEVR